MHGVKHMDAKQEVISFIEKYWDKEYELQIITGNSIKMKGIAINVIQEYKLPFQISEMCFGKITTWT